MLIHFRKDKNIFGLLHATNVVVNLKLLDWKSKQEIPRKFAVGALIVNLLTYESSLLFRNFALNFMFEIKNLAIFMHFSEFFHNYKKLARDAE